MSDVVNIDDYRQEKTIEEKVEEVDLDLIRLLVDLDYSHEQVLEIMEIKRNWGSGGNGIDDFTARVNDGVIHIKGFND